MQIINDLEKLSKANEELQKEGESVLPNNDPTGTTQSTPQSNVRN